jgi:DNA ligase (NAD+)
MGLLKDIPGIYTLDYEKISQLEGFGQRSIDNLKTAIDNSKSQSLNRLIFGLGIRYVGEATAKTLAKAVDHLLDFEKFSLEELQNLEDVGIKVAGSIYQFFHLADNIEMIKKLEKLGINLKNTKKEVEINGKLDQQTFLFTGSLPTLKRSEAEELVEKNGGRLLGSVSSKLNYLVVGEDAGSKLDKAKKISSIKIMNEEEFLKMIKK